MALFDLRYFDILRIIVKFEKVFNLKF